MKILALHSDFIEFEAKKKAIKEPEELKNKQEKVGQALVVFMSVEERDEANPDSTSKQCVEHYVHLTNSPSNPKTALQVLDSVEKELKADYEVHRSPFGWYKSFNIKVKGHPLAELSREFGPEEVAKNNKSFTGQALKKIIPQERYI